MPGLIRGMAKTAAVVGTATATRNAVNRRQADKNAQAYTNAMNTANAQEVSPPQTQPVTAAPSPSEDTITQLERLGALKARGSSLNRNMLPRRQSCSECKSPNISAGHTRPALIKISILIKPEDKTILEP